MKKKLEHRIVINNNETFIQECNDDYEKLYKVTLSRCT